MLDFDALDGAAPVGRFAAGLGLAALHEAQRRNFRALLAANQTAFAGYQDLCARLVERCAAHLAEARDRIEAMQDRPLDAGSPARHIAEAGAAFARGLADLRGLSEIGGGDDGGCGRHPAAAHRGGIDRTARRDVRRDAFRDAGGRAA